MGLLSSCKGKLKQHLTLQPIVDPGKCTFCNVCMRWCPESAIIEKQSSKGYAFIIKEKCIGCGECLTVCKYDAVKYNWLVQSADGQIRVAKHALGAISVKMKKHF